VFTLVLLFGNGPISKTNANEGHAEKIIQILEMLKHSKTGLSLLKKAQAKWRLDSIEALSAKIHFGVVSKTDAVLTRTYDPTSSKEIKERHTSIYLKSNQSMTETVLDLSHELVHATADPGWDPYDPDLSLARYMRSVIEGNGGEIEAVASECSVAAEIFSGESIAIKRCGQFWGKPKENLKSAFYRVGKEGLLELKEEGRLSIRELPDLSANEPILYSSTGGTTYPQALLSEYRVMTESACVNSRKRLLAVSTYTAPSGRSPASRFIKSRCE
jgi:hypothetical protein